MWSEAGRQHLVVACLLICAAGCDLWPRDGDYDPLRCEPRCTSGVCYRGKCVPVDMDMKSPPILDSQAGDVSKVKDTSPPKCANDCSSGMICCAGKCSDDKNDHANCGKCGTVCNAGMTCCSGKCVDIKTNTDNCGKCGYVCQPMPNSKPGCSVGMCDAICTKPWEDCDKKYDNGCEIPTGVPNRCNRGGLTLTSPPTGCGTAYCGQGSGSSVANMGLWYCSFCTHCHKFAGGYASCIHNPPSKPGNFSTTRCSTCCDTKPKDKICPK